MMPGFFKYMPEKSKGAYRARAFRRYFNGRVVVKYDKAIRGRRRAYVVARLLALWLDLNTPYIDGDVGVEWEIEQRLSKP